MARNDQNSAMSGCRGKVSHSKSCNIRNLCKSWQVMASLDFVTQVGDNLQRNPPPRYERLILLRELLLPKAHECFHAVKGSVNFT